MSKTKTFKDEAAVGPSPKSIAISGMAKRVGLYLGLALFSFLLGLVPMWLKAREAASQRDAARRELLLSRMNGTLASAAIDARRGEYEPARQTVGDFFTTLRTQIDAGEDSVLTAAQRERLRPLLDQRDDLITLLARGEPVSADRLSDIYVSYRKAVNEV